MAQTLAQVADSIARQLGEEYTDLDVQEQFDEWVVEALHEILGEAPWGFALQDSTISSVATQTEYSLDLGTGDVTTIYRTSDMVRELKRTTRSALVNAGKDMTITENLHIDSVLQKASLFSVDGRDYNRTPPAVRVVGVVTTANR